MSNNSDKEAELKYGEIYNNDNSHSEVGNGQSEKKRDVLIYDSVAIHFDIGIFFSQLLINSIWPFGIFFSPNIRAQQFSQTSFSSIFYNHFLTASVYVMVISYVMMSYEAEYTQFKHFQGSVWYPLLFFFLHRCSIAIKYASMSRTEYQRFMDTKNTDDVINTYVNQFQVCILFYLLCFIICYLYFRLWSCTITEICTIIMIAVFFIHAFNRLNLILFEVAELALFERQYCNPVFSSYCGYKGRGTHR